MPVYTGTSGNDILFGSVSADSIYGYAGDDYLWGNDGNDFLQGGAGADTLNGGNGIDTVDYNGTAGVYINLTTGYGYYGEAAGDRLYSIENVQGTIGYGDTLIGSAVDNVLSGYSGNDYLYGNDGNDTLYGMDGNDFLQGGNGADWLDGGAGVDTVDYNGAAGVYVNLTTGYGYYGEAAGDRLFNVENVQGTGLYGDTLIGNAADNILSGYGGADYLYGNDGNDTLYGGDGNDFLQGGNGADWLDGGAGVDTVDYNGAAGVWVDLSTGYGYYGEAAGDRLFNIENVQGTGGYGDTLIGSAVANVLSGYGGDDYLYGRDGNDTLYGMDGNDFLQGGNGADWLGGGAGVDTVDYNGTAGVWVDLSTGYGYYGEAAGDRLVNIEDVQGTSGYGDTLVGSAVANVLSGYGGGDALYGLAGNDTLNGGDGSDFLAGGDGADALNGGNGNDTASYYDSTAGVAINLVTGTSSGGFAAGDVLTGIENLTGSQYNDALVGTSADNVLQGLNGNDVFAGAGGQDTLTGGAGSDRFVYGNIGQSTLAAPDRITDFSHAQADHIDLAAIDANTAVTGDQAFSFIGTAAFTHHAGELHYGFAGTDTVISGDVNGDGTADFSIVLTGNVALVASDFML